MMTSKLTLAVAVLALAACAASPPAYEKPVADGNGYTESIGRVDVKYDGKAWTRITVTGVAPLRGDTVEARVAAGQLAATQAKAMFVAYLRENVDLRATTTTKSDGGTLDVNRSETVEQRAAALLKGVQTVTRIHDGTAYTTLILIPQSIDTARDVLRAMSS